jgi:hypothetical protein
MHGVGSVFEQAVFIESDDCERLNQIELEFYVSVRMKLYIEMTECIFQ